MEITVAPDDHDDDDEDDVEEESEDCIHIASHTAVNF